MGAGKRESCIETPQLSLSILKVTRAIMIMYSDFLQTLTSTEPGSNQNKEVCGASNCRTARVH